MNTNTNLTAPKSHTSLASSGILANVRMTTTTLSVADKSVSDEICAQKKADDDSGVFLHKLIGKNKHHQAVMSYRATLDNWIKNIGYEWGGGWYIIPTVLYPAFRAQFDAHLTEFNSRLDAFIAEYPQILSNIAFKQGDLFDRSKYPDSNHLRSRFSLALKTMPVPENDWRVQVSADQAKDLHEHHDRQHTETMIEIGRAQSEKLKDYMQRIAKACTVETDAEGNVKRGRLYETTIEQALELCDTIASFNPIRDLQLEDARVELANILSNISIPALKESNSLRSATKQNIDSILSKFGK
jgi:hypothetical protein